MKYLVNCTNCIVKQIQRSSAIANLSKDSEKEILQDVLKYLSEADLNKSSPEIYAVCYNIIQNKIGTKDLYKEIKYKYNNQLLEIENEISKIIENSQNPLKTALELAITGNLLDLAIINDFSFSKLKELFEQVDNGNFAIDNSTQLIKDLSKANTLLYLGDNCGEIVLDKLFISEIKKEFPLLKIYFAVRGKPAVNDALIDDALQVGMDRVATIINNGDCSLGTVLQRTSKEFNELFNSSDLIISKGQGNFESLSDLSNDNLYFLFMAKCPDVSNLLKVNNFSIICKKN